MIGGGSLRPEGRTGSAESGRLPDFIVIGAAKSGTTALAEYLGRHPGIFMSSPKEPCFFSDEDVFSRGHAWYRGLFKAASESQVCGEASTTYTRWPHTADAPARIARILPDVRMIYLLRHPVDRAYSHYAHHMRKGVTASFESALQASDEYVDCSLYIMQIERYLRVFPREQLHVALTDDLRLDPKTTLLEMLRFLEVPSLDLLGGGPVKANETGAEHYLRFRLRQAMESVPLGRELLEAMPTLVRRRSLELVTRSSAGRRVAEKARLEPMKEATRRQLLRRFAAPNRELAEFLGRHLSAWNR